MLWVAAHAVLAQLGQLFGIVLQDGLTGGAHLIEAAHWRGRRGLLEDGEVTAGFFGNRQHRRDKAVECLLALGFGWLDHQRFWHNQREVNRRRVEAEVDQPFGNVQRANLGRTSDLALQHGLVHAHAVIGDWVGVLQLHAHIVRIQYRRFADLAQTCRAKRANVCPGPYQHSEVAIECFHAANRFFRRKKFIRVIPEGRSERATIYIWLEIDGACCAPPLRINHPHPRPRQKWGQCRRAANRTRTGATAAMGRGKGFVQVVMHEIEADLARLDDAQNGVEVRAVTIHQAARFVHKLRHFADVFLEQANRIRVGQHHASGARRKLGLQVVDIDIATGVAFDLDNLVACHSCRSRVRAVGRVRYQNLGAPGVAPVKVVGAEHQNARQFALRARRRLERHIAETANFAQVVLKLVHQPQRALRQRTALQRVGSSEARQTRHFLVKLRIVFHSAASERIKSRVDAEITLTNTRVMAHYLWLG